MDKGILINNGIIQYHQLDKVKLDINELLGLHPFVANKLNYQIKNYSLEELNNIYKELMQIDINNKSGNIDLYTGIINVMCNI